MRNMDEYEKFSQHMEKTYPEIFQGKYGGFAIGPGWWPIVESLCKQIQSHIDWRNKTRAALLEKNPHNHPILDEVPQVVVEQIKEKFGGLRFYYQGGDEEISGMARMAEVWASHTCEECGAPGQARNGGWIKTLCDKHEEIRQENLRAREMKISGLEE